MRAFQTTNAIAAVKTVVVKHPSYIVEMAVEPVVVHDFASCLAP